MIDMDKETYNKFKTKFKAYQKMSMDEQTINREDIISSFKMFWDHNPTEAESQILRNT